jgi:hypothetical protein
MLVFLLLLVVVLLLLLLLQSYPILVQRCSKSCSSVHSLFCRHRNGCCCWHPGIVLDSHSNDLCQMLR